MHLLAISRRLLRNLSTSGMTNVPAARSLQVLMVNVYSFLTAGALGFFGLLYMLQGRTRVGFLEIAIAAAVLGNAWLLRVTKNIELASEVLLACMLTTLIVLFVTGGVEGTGMFWFFAFPAAAFFLAGRAHGLLWIALLFVVTLLLVMLGQMEVIQLPYTTRAIRQMFICLSVVTFGIYVYQQNRERADTAAQELEEDMYGSKQSLQEEKSKAEAIIANIGQGIVLTDHNGLVVLINQAAEDMLGWRQNELKGKSFVEVIPLRSDNGHPFAPEAEPLERVWQVDENVSGEGNYRRKDGSSFVADVMATPIHNDGKIVGVIGAIRDVSEDRQIDRAKSEFVTLASHQLRTPISGIAWLSELLLSDEDHPLTPEQHDQVQQIYRSNKRMAKLVGEMLIVSGLELGSMPIRPEPTDIGALTQQILKEQKETVETAKTLHIKAHFDPDLPLVPVDLDAMKMILEHLITNALKYTPPDGSISLELVKGGGDVCLVISDSGYGIPKQQQSKVFQKFFRADNIKSKDTDGTGLGLYIVKAILGYVGGSISFDSTEEKGSTFILAIPLSGMTPHEPKAKKHGEAL